MSLVSHLPDWAGTLPAWITAISAAGGFGLLIRLYLGHRAMNIKADQVKIDARKVNQDGAASLRDHWLKEVESLRGQLGRMAADHRTDMQAMEQRYKALMDEADERHDQCIKDRDLLREQVNALKDEITGLIRLIAQNSASKILDVSSREGALEGMSLSEEVIAAAERVERLFKKE